MAESVVDDGSPDLHAKMLGKLDVALGEPVLPTEILHCDARIGLVSRAATISAARELTEKSTGERIVRGA